MVDDFAGESLSPAALEGLAALQVESLDFWRRDGAPLAELPHVVCKLSGLLTEADDANGDFDESHVHEFSNAAVELFGPERLMFGSDWPVCTLVASYARTAQVLENWSKKLSTADCACIWGNNAARVYAARR
jgi:L-fuconolactonase